MTDNTQELDEILDKFGWTCVADGGDGYGLQNEDVSEAKQAILDWHNKQVEELLDRLESKMEGLFVKDEGGYEACKDPLEATPLLALQEERQRYE